MWIIILWWHILGLDVLVLCKLGVWFCVGILIEEEPVADIKPIVYRVFTSSSVVCTTKS